MTLSTSFRAHLVLAGGLGLVWADAGPPLRVLRATPSGTAPPAASVTVTFDRPVAGSLDHTVDPAQILERAHRAGPDRVARPGDGPAPAADPLDPEHAYRVTVRDRFEAMDGSRLAGDYTFTFRVRGPRVLAGVPVGPDRQPRFLTPTPTLDLVLDAPADPATLARRVYLELDTPVPRPALEIADRHGPPLRSTRAADGTLARRVPLPLMDPDVIAAFLVAETAGSTAIPAWLHGRLPARSGPTFARAGSGRARPPSPCSSRASSSLCHAPAGEDAAAALGAPARAPSGQGRHAGTVPQPRAAGTIGGRGGGRRRSLLRCHRGILEPGRSIAAGGSGARALVRQSAGERRTGSRPPRGHPRTPGHRGVRRRGGDRARRRVAARTGERVPGAGRWGRLPAGSLAPVPGGRAARTGAACDEPDVLAPGEHVVEARVAGRRESVRIDVRD